MPRRKMSPGEKAEYESRRNARDHRHTAGHVNEMRSPDRDRLVRTYAILSRQGRSFEYGVPFRGDCIVHCDVCGDAIDFACHDCKFDKLLLRTEWTGKVWICSACALNIPRGKEDDVRQRGEEEDDWIERLARSVRGESMEDSPRGLLGKNRADGTVGRKPGN